MNQRLIVEFLLLKPPKNCATASRVLESWDKSSVGSQEALKADYGWASQYVAHIAEPKPGELDRNMHPVAMIMKTDLVIDAVEQFAEQLEHAGHELAGLLRTGVAAARSELGSLRRYRS